MTLDKGLHDPIGRHPVLPSGEHSDGGHQFLVGDVDILVNDRGVKIMAVQFLYLG